MRFFVGKTFDRCKCPQSLRVNTLDGIVEVPAEQYRFLRLRGGSKFRWFCGSNKEAARAPAGANVVMCYRTCAKRLIAWYGFREVSF